MEKSCGPGAAHYSELIAIGEWTVAKIVIINCEPLETLLASDTRKTVDPHECEAPDHHGTIPTGYFDTCCSHSCNDRTGHLTWKDNDLEKDNLSRTINEEMPDMIWETESNLDGITKDKEIKSPGEEEHAANTGF